ncbi:response regulator transcription factor [Vicingus serpentipes]|jgi:two-component system, LytTR family, response regulator|uniref:Response regulator transcription factor n=1 Tax=Vicingus serpentipes TaxID=1926625 RepID=A0A5C6RPG6_9FLAO|nr:LytTR family DNA-binding domain-containing protein [Vicingus serpentipes]TXB64228.1 response regulator transcription factor [Vicingus serpentipes]
MKAIIVDDERLARKELHNLLAKYPSIEIIGEYDNAEDAINEIERQKPDLVFLDIHMPGKDGFGVLEELIYVPQVIFVTAYDEYAIKAFEVNALDYLLKPIQPERLEEAINKLSAQLQTNETSTNKLTAKDQVFVKDGEKCWFVKLEDVPMFESEGNYVRVYFKGNKPLILKSLNNLANKLDEDVFFRANRKFIINLNWIEDVENWFNGGLMVKLKTGEKVEISRRQATKLKEMKSL